MPAPILPGLDPESPALSYKLSYMQSAGCTMRCQSGMGEEKSGTDLTKNAVDSRGDTPVKICLDTYCHPVKNASTATRLVRFPLFSIAGLLALGLLFA